MSQLRLLALAALALACRQGADVAPSPSTSPGTITGQPAAGGAAGARSVSSRGTTTPATATPSAPSSRPTPVGAVASETSEGALDEAPSAPPAPKVLRTGSLSGFGQAVTFPKNLKGARVKAPDGTQMEVARQQPGSLWIRRTWDNGEPTELHFEATELRPEQRLVFVDGFTLVRPDFRPMDSEWWGREIIKEADRHVELMLESWVIEGEFATRPETGKRYPIERLGQGADIGWAVFTPQCPQSSKGCVLVGKPKEICKERIRRAPKPDRLHLWFHPAGC